MILCFLGREGSHIAECRPVKHLCMSPHRVANSMAAHHPLTPRCLLGVFLPVTEHLDDFLVEHITMHECIVGKSRVF